MSLAASILSPIESGTSPTFSPYRAVFKLGSCHRKRERSQVKAKKIFAAFVSPILQSLEERQSLQIQLEEKMENLWVQLHDSAKGHRSATEEKRRVYQELRRRDKTGLAEVLENNKKLLKLMVSILLKMNTKGIFRH